MLILCKAWAPRLRLCDVQNGRKAFVSPLQAIWFLFLCLKNKIFFILLKKKKVMLILAVVSWRGAAFLFTQTQRQSKQTWGRLQLRLRGGLQSRVNGRHMPLLHVSLSSVTVAPLPCVRVRQRRGLTVCFSRLHLGGKSVVIVQESQSVCCIHSEVVISRSYTGSLCLMKAAFVLFHMLSDPPSYTLLKTSTGGINSLSRILNPCTLILILT